jgi:hypothetical protein
MGRRHPVCELGNELQKCLENSITEKGPRAVCQRAGELMLGQLIDLKFSPHTLGRQ